MKNPTETLNEFFAAWDFSPDGIVVHADAPAWVYHCVRYVNANMNEPENQDIFLLLHRFSAYALKHASSIDKVGPPAYIDNAITLTIDSMPASVQGLVEWLAFNHASRTHHIDELFTDADDVFSDFRSVLIEAYSCWARSALGHVKDYLLTVR